MCFHCRRCYGCWRGEENKWSFNTSKKVQGGSLAKKGRVRLGAKRAGLVAGTGHAGGGGEVEHRSPDHQSPLNPQLPHPVGTA